MTHGLECQIMFITVCRNEHFCSQHILKLFLNVTMTRKFKQKLFSLTCFLAHFDVQVGISSIPRTSYLLEQLVLCLWWLWCHPSSSAKSIVFQYHSSSTLSVPSSTSLHGIRYSRIPSGTTVVFSMPDSVKWNGKRSLKI